MRGVFITGSATAFPPYRVSQSEAAARIVSVIGEKRRIDAIARSTKIDTRAIAFSAEQIAQLSSVEQRNRLYQEIAPHLAEEALRQVYNGDGADCLVATSCTGYMVPGMDVQLAQALGLRLDTVRLPITEAGCAGGVVALARATDFLQAHPSSTRALVASVELCSLAFQRSNEPGSITSNLLFGDGAAAVSLETRDDKSEGLKILDSASLLVPNSTDAIGFDLTNEGFASRLSRDIAGLLEAPVAASVACLTSRNGLGVDDIAFWLIHPGGPRILQATQTALNLSDSDLRWSWESLREQGNMSSVAILDVLHRYRSDAAAPDGYGVVLAFGPGVSLELLLVRRC